MPKVQQWLNPRDVSFCLDLHKKTCKSLLVAVVSVDLDYFTLLFLLIMALKFGPHIRYMTCYFYIFWPWLWPSDLHFCISIWTLDHVQFQMLISADLEIDLGFIFFTNIILSSGVWPVTIMTPLFCIFVPIYLLCNAQFMFFDWIIVFYLLLYCCKCLSFFLYYNYVIYILHYDKHIKQPVSMFCNFKKEGYLL